MGGGNRPPPQDPYSYQTVGPDGKTQQTDQRTAQSYAATQQDQDERNSNKPGVVASTGAIGGTIPIGGTGEKKVTPPPPDYMAAASAQNNEAGYNLAQQTAANRPDIATTFGTQQWAQDSSGRWYLSNQLDPSLGVDQLKAQVGQMNGNPLNTGGPIGTGDQARDQAISAAYNQATSRLDPQFGRQEEALRAQLANQGMNPNSEAARNAMQQFGQTRNDAYTSALNAAIGQGTAAQQATFAQNLAAHQQAIQDQLAARNLPIQQLKDLQGLGATPNFLPAGVLPGADYSGAAAALGNYNLGVGTQQAQAAGDTAANTGQAIGAIASIASMASSDEALKQNVERFEVEVMPGVPLASWEYKFDPGKRHLGVIAQDLARVAPEYVVRHPDGFLLVDYSFLFEGET